jgi:predicted nucleic acid-binding Zn ribbon protein
MPQTRPDYRPESVATLPVVASCPICGVPLQGRQTVCSAKCRIQRSMAMRAAKRDERDAKVRLLLGEALALLDYEKEPVT